jgi:hypothetical protein
MTGDEFHPVQERDRIAIRRVTAIALGVCVAGAVSVVVEWRMLRAQSATAASSPVTAPPPGLVEFSPIWDSERGVLLEAQQRKLLDRAEWVDRDAGIARIPIERAMDLVVDAGTAAEETPGFDAEVP